MTASARRRFLLPAALLASSALATGAAVWPAFADQAASAAPPPIAAAPTAPGAMLPSFADLAARVRPAVVTITSIERVQAQSGASPFPPGSPQDRMFDRFFGGAQQGAHGQPARGLGSGFIVDAAGHIVTNNHVVEGAKQVTVTLADGRDFKAKVVGTDPRTDLAVLKIDAGGALPHLALGDSDKARVGDWVVAIGNPFGLGGTVTTGTLSARGRQIGAGPYDDFLQVDAAINRGNSGGPLFAQDGNVIGVNTAIISPSGGSVGIGFAIPSNVVKQVVAQLEQSGHVERGFLGASTQPVTPEIATALNLPKPGGALVASVVPDSPASRAGLHSGDVITAVGDKTVGTPSDLARTIGELAPGDRAVLQVQRNGNAKTLQATLVELRDKPAADGTQQANSGQQDRNGGALGLALAASEDGVTVAAVRPDSVADTAGLQPGDIILGVQDQDVASPEAAVKAIQAAGKQGRGVIALRVKRGDATSFVALQVGKNNGAG